MSFVFVRLSGKERAEIKQAALDTKVSVSRFMRVAALQKARRRTTHGMVPPVVIVSEV